MEEKKRTRKMIFIICGIAAALLLIFLIINSLNNRLPEEAGVSVYYSFSETAEGRVYWPLSAGGHAYGLAGRKVWLSRREYEQDAEQHGLAPYFKPLSVWTYSEKIPGINRFLVEEKGCPFFFSVKENGEAKAETIAVRRWPLELAGTDAVMADSWTGREDVEYSWKEGWLGGLPKGEIRLEPGYLYSIFVTWGRGWDEFSFAVEQAQTE